MKSNKAKNPNRRVKTQKQKRKAVQNSRRKSVHLQIEDKEPLKFSGTVEEKAELAVQLINLADRFQKSDEEEIISELKFTIEQISEWKLNSKVSTSSREISDKIKKIFGISTDLSELSLDTINKIKKLILDFENQDAVQKSLSTKINDKTSKISETTQIASQDALDKLDLLYSELSNLRQEYSEIENTIKKYKSNIISLLPNVENVDSSYQKNSEKNIDDMSNEKTIVNSDNKKATKSKPKPSKSYTKPEIEQFSTKTDKTDNIKNQKLKADQNITGSPEKYSSFWYQNEERKIKEVFAKLILDDKFSIATRFAQALQSICENSPLPSRCLELAAISRISFESFDSSTQFFVSKIDSAFQSAGSNYEANAIIFGALLRISILQSTTSARSTLRRLSLGSFWGDCLSDLFKVISELNHAFSPTIEDLAYLAGKSEVSRSKRIKKEISDWIYKTSKRNAPCQPSTSLLHRLTTGNGEFQLAFKAINEEKIQEAFQLIDNIVERYKNHDLIDARIIELNPTTQKKSRKIFKPNTMIYLYRLIDEGRNLLIQWKEAVETEKNTPSENIGKHQSMIQNLLDICKKTMSHLENQKTLEDELRHAICKWLFQQIKDLKITLQGQIPKLKKEYDAARSDELDLLPVPVALKIKEEDNLSVHSGEIEYSDDIAVLNFLMQNEVPTLEKAIELHCSNGAFRRASRLLDWIENTEQKEKIELFVNKKRIEKINSTITDVSERIKNLREVGKIDLKHQVKIQNYINDLVLIPQNLNLERDQDLSSIATRDTNYLSDIDSIYELLNRVDELVKVVRNEVISDQRVRLNDALISNPSRAKDIENLLSRLEVVPLDYAEDQIAQIRNDQSPGYLNIKTDGPFELFFPDFVKKAESSDWPSNYEQYENVFLDDDKLNLDVDRINAAKQLLKNWFVFSANVKEGIMKDAEISSLLQDLSILDVRITNRTQIQGELAWILNVKLKIPSANSWFIPPVFGSRSKGSFEFLILHHSVLIEKILPNIKKDIPTFIIICGRLTQSRRIDIAKRLHQISAKALLIDESLIAFIASQKEDRLKILFDCGLPFGRTESYITDAGRLPREMFFGREQEITKIVGKNAEGIMVYGGRQLGKTALLAQVEELYDNIKDGFIVTYDEVKRLGTKAQPADEIWRVIGKKLSMTQYSVVKHNQSSSENIIEDIKKWLNGEPNRRIICLFDETDEFLSSEAKNNFPNIMKLKNLMEVTDRSFKVVFAGLHHVQRIYRYSNSPLAHFGKEICVGPLTGTYEDREAAYRMVVEPMRAAGFKFEDENTPDEILSYVNHYPSLVQVYLKELLEYLHKIKLYEKNEPLWTIPRDVLFQGEGFNTIESEIHRKFSYTLDLDPRYKIIAYVLGDLKWMGNEKEVLDDGLSAQTINDEIVKYWPPTLELLSLSGTKDILDEMHELGILGKIESSMSVPTYCLRTRQVANMLGNHLDIIERLIELEKTESPHEYQITTNRRTLGNVKNVKTAKNYSPLTDIQLRDLISDTSTIGTRFVIGTKLFGLSNVGKAIENYVESHNFIQDEKNFEVNFSNSKIEFGNVINEKLSDDKNIQIVINYPDNIQDANNVISFSDNISSVKSGQIIPIIVLNSEVPEFREIAISRSAFILKPWGGEMVRTHVNQIEEIDDRKIRDTVLDKTGGIPDQIVNAYWHLKKTNNPLDEIKNIEEIELESFNFIENNLLHATSIISEILTLDIDNSLDTMEQLYDLICDEISANCENDLISIGPILHVLGILDQFSPDNKFIRISHFGRLLARKYSQHVT